MRYALYKKGEIADGCLLWWLRHSLWRTSPSQAISQTNPSTIDMIDLSKPFNSKDRSLWNYISKVGSGEEPDHPVNSGTMFSDKSNLYLYGGGISTAPVSSAPKICLRTAYGSLVLPTVSRIEQRSMTIRSSVCRLTCLCRAHTLLWAAIWVCAIAICWSIILNSWWCNTLMNQHLLFLSESLTTFAILRRLNTISQC